MATVRILVTLDSNYVFPLQVMLTSLFLNSSGEPFEIYAICDRLSDSEKNELRLLCEAENARFIPLEADSSLFADAPLLRHYTRAMYFRLFACFMLPEEVDRVLYLDPDILVINPVTPLYELELKGNAIAAAMHSGIASLAGGVNRLRLRTNIEKYYNSGVMLMDIRALRGIIRPEDVYGYVSKHGKELLLPDQDIINALYGRYILPVDETVYNYDARNYNAYLLKSIGKTDISWVMQNTSILHFCGSRKPWQTPYPFRLGLLYRHYMQITLRGIRAASGGSPC